MNNFYRRLGNLVGMNLKRQANVLNVNELIFFITYKCNFRCQTCFYVRTIENSLDGKQELTLDEIKKISLSIGSLYRLLISGGEPFLRDDLAQICQIFSRQNKIKSIHLPTNGFNTDRIYIVTKDILNSCSDIELTLSVSLDGLEEAHDRIKGVKGSFTRALETISRVALLKKKFKKLSVDVISVVNNRNLDEILPLAEFVKNNLDVDAHGPSPVRGKPYDNILSAPSYEQWRDLSHSLIKYHKYYNQKRAGRFKSYISTNRARYLYNIYGRVLKGEGFPFCCQAGNSIAVLEPNGDVRICELTDPVGSVRNAGYDIKKILSSKNAVKLRNDVRKCSCNHACFIYPSIDSNLQELIKSYLF